MNGGDKRFIERLPLAADRPWLAIGATLLLVGIGAAARFAADPLLPPGFPYITFFPVVVATAFLFGTRAGIVSAVLCGLISWHQFLPPVGSFALNRGTSIALLFYAFVVGVDIAFIHWAQAANAKLAGERETNRLLAENRELLFRELQHRVSNNLQVAASLLTLQKRGVSDEAALRALDEAANRLGVIGRISRQLYDPEGGTLGLEAFLRQLCADVIEASGRSDVALGVEADRGIALSPDAAIPVALIVAEAVANALEHGVAGRRDAAIRVRLKREGGEVAIEVSDNGVGLKPGFDVGASESLGLRIATMLAKQLRGTFQLEGLDGTTARLVVPA